MNDARTTRKASSRRAHGSAARMASSASARSSSDRRRPFGSPPRAAMNDAETLAAIRELAELRRKATPGPWEPEATEQHRDRAVVYGPDGDSFIVAHQNLGLDTDPVADAAFIAAAGSLDFDALIALLDA